MLGNRKPRGTKMRLGNSFFNVFSKTLLIAGISIAFLFTFANQAIALTIGSTTPASGYPGPTTSTSSTPNTINQNIGIGVSGKTLTASSCGFQANSTVNLTLNGISIGTQTANSSGCVITTITVVSVSSTGGQIQVNGKTYNVTLTNDDLTAVGTGTNGAQLTVNNSFGVSSSSSSISGTTGKPFFGEMVGAFIILMIAGGLSLIMFFNRKHRSNQ